MKTFYLAVATLVIGTPAFAADVAVPAKAPPPAPAYVSPWDFAFGAAITSDYRFRGIAQSNRQPSVSAYFEPRYNVTPDLQLYIGAGAASISFPNRAAAEVDVYGGIRPTFGPVALDFGVFGYLYPGGQCFNAAALPGQPGFSNECLANGNLPLNGNVIKSDLSYYEFYGKVTWTVNDAVALGANVYYSPSFLNSGASGTYASGTAKFTAPATWFGDSGVGAYLSGEYGYQWLGTSDAFYGNIKFKDYGTWNVGIGFTYKVFTLDIRYSDTSLSKGDCNAFTGDHTTTDFGYPTAANGGAPFPGSRWCGAAGIVKFSADLTALQNLK
jgi:hypothetical protein